MISQKVSPAVVEGLTQAFTSIKDRALKVEKEVEDFFKKSILTLGSEEIDVLWSKVKSIVKDYNDYSSRLISLFSDAANVVRLVSFTETDSYDYLTKRKSLANSLGVLDAVITYSQAAIGYLDRFRIGVSEEVRNKLSQLRLDVEKFYQYDYYVAKHLEEAVNECEEGHNLAAGLIAGKCIVYMLEQLKSVVGVDKGDEEIAKRLCDKLNIRDEDRRHVMSSVIKAGRIARNIFTHDIRKMPEAEEALSLIVDAVWIAKYYIQLIATSKDANTRP